MPLRLLRKIRLEEAHSRFAGAALVLDQLYHRGARFITFSRALRLKGPPESEAIGKGINEIVGVMENSARVSQVDDKRFQTVAPEVAIVNFNDHKRLPTAAPC